MVSTFNSPSRLRSRARHAAAKLANTKNTLETEDDPSKISKEPIVIAENAKENISVKEVDQLKVADKVCKSDEKVDTNDVEHGYKYFIDHVSYSKICEEGSDKTNSEEDLAYHEPEDVL